ncbi:MAG: ABC transporter permease [Nocardioidaceae bacterium]
MSGSRTQDRHPWRTLLLIPFGLFFFVPLLSMLDFSTRNPATNHRTFAYWDALVKDPDVRSAIIVSLLLALFTVVLMLVLLVPTMIWVRLRVPKASRLIEFLCLMPLTIPALVIVVGIRNVFSWVTYIFGDSALTLTLPYVILVLPYAYRSIDSALAAINVVTLSEAARSLGARWLTVIWRIVVPNITSGLMSAAFVAVALVLGEYTFASLLNFPTPLPVVQVQLGQTSGPTSVAAALASFAFVAVLLVLISFFDRRKGLGDTTRTVAVATPAVRAGKESDAH